ncbi:unnamed protein product [Durusdinium trenchii]|uniref:Uncharacterized protein n=1 Tax=Durusdinium trenchii TaxID=1381693 RepID=A0ABP0SII7_9DINO
MGLGAVARCSVVLLWITFSGICFKVLGGSQRVIPRNLLRGVHLVDDAEASTSTQPTASTNSSRSTTSSISTSSSPADSEPSPPLPNQTHQTPNHQNQTKLQVDPTNFSDRLEVAGRTAICVVGGLRSFTLPKIYQSILKFKAKVDPATVFLVMHETASLGHDTRKQVPFKVGKQSLKAAVDALQPVHVEVHSDSTCKQFESVEPNVSCCSDDVVSNYLQLGWIWHCLNVVKQYEAEHNVTFELIVRLRPDVVYFGLEYLPSKDTDCHKGWEADSTRGHTPCGPGARFSVPRAAAEERDHLGTEAEQETPRVLRTPGDRTPGDQAA